MRSGLLSTGVFVLACHSGSPFEFQSLGQGAAAGCANDCNADPRAVAEMSLGVRFACARFAAGAVKCWGQNDFGVLGDAARELVADPSEVGVLDFGAERRVIQLSAGWEHVCVVFDDHRARCWGRNQYGQLGRGNTEDYGDNRGETLAELSDLPLESIVQISAGVNSTCALVSAEADTPGRVHCWGRDQGGALGDTSSGDYGDDEPVDASRPVALPALAVAVATGGDLACALLSTGAVHCWGDNWARTLGIGETECDVGDEMPCFSEQGRVPDIPVAGLGSRGIVELVVNHTSACVLDNSGRVLCWGRNSQSRLGYPELLEGEYLGSPPGSVALGEDVAVVGLALGTRHACALDRDGTIRCWGEAGPALGYGMAAETGSAGIGGIQTPEEAYALRADRGVVDVGDFDAGDGTDPVDAVYAGGSTTCVRVSGAVRCFGENGFGELGYGDPAQVGAIGDDAPPGEEYVQLGRADVPLFSE
ncbi:MAG TPA: hypothetical protein VF989_01845 [Polyangiaceae bacterium]